MTAELTRMIQTYVLPDSRIQVISKAPRIETLNGKTIPVTYRDPNTGLLVANDEIRRNIRP